MDRQQHRLVTGMRKEAPVGDAPPSYIGTGGVDVVSRDAAAQALGAVVQLHFDKTVEKKRAADAQKQELWGLYLAFLLVLSVLLSGVATSPPGRLQCRHLWAPAGLLSLAHLAFYAAFAHHLRCLNGFRYQRRCHKLMLALAADRLRMLKSAGEVVAGGGRGGALPGAALVVSGQVQAQLGILRRHICLPHRHICILRRRSRRHPLLLGSSSFSFSVHPSKNLCF